MKKVLKDNRGWGLADEFIIIAVLALALFVAVFLISRNFGDIEPIDTDVSIESAVLTAATSYVEEYYGSVNENDELLINHTTLINEGYLDSDLVDECDWFIKVIGDDFDVYSECD